MEAMKKRLRIEYEMTKKMNKGNTEYNRETIEERCKHFANVHFDLGYEEIFATQYADIFQAAQNGDASCIKRLCSEEPERINDSDINGNTVLHLSVKYKRQGCTRTICKIPNVNINYRNNMNRTALHFAAMNEDEIICGILLEKKANILITDKAGNTAIHFACMFDSVKILELLYDCLQNYESLMDEYGYTKDAFQMGNQQGFAGAHLATSYGSIKALQFLMDKGISIEQYDNNKDTPAHKAARFGNYGTLDFLKEKGINFDIENIEEENVYDLMYDNPRFS